MNPQDFLNQPCAFLLPNGQAIFGILQTDGTNFGLNAGTPLEIGVPPEAIAEIRPITVDPTINVIRAVFVLQHPNISNETSKTNPERESSGT